MRNWSQQDLNQIKNLLVALNRAEYKVQGQELLAFGQAVRWLSMIHDEATQALKPVLPSKTEAIAKLTEQPVKLDSKKQVKKPKKK
jgi:hypothetical protein